MENGTGMRCAKNTDLLRLEAAMVRLFEVFPAEPLPTKTFVDVLRDEPISKIEENVRWLVKNWKPEYGRKYPCPAEIINPRRVQEAEKERDRDWDIFLMKAFNPYKKLPEKLAIIKRRIGAGRVENATEDETFWIKKEFYEFWEKERSAEELVIDRGIDKLAETAVDDRRLLPGSERGKNEHNRSN